MKDTENPFAGLVAIPEFPDYYVDEFNRVFSFKRKIPREILPWVQHYPTGTSTLRITLFTANGGRRSVSYKKALQGVYARHLLFTDETFDRREAAKEEHFAELAEKEAVAKEKRDSGCAQRETESQKMLAEIHIDTPIGKLDPAVASLVEKLRIKREQESFGDLY